MPRRLDGGEPHFVLCARLHESERKQMRVPRKDDAGFARRGANGCEGRYMLMLRSLGVKPHVRSRSSSLDQSDGAPQAVSRP